MISTIIRNLISNAIKFTEEGGEILISTKMRRNKLLVSVSDTGIGIDEDRLQKLFCIDENSSTLGTQNEKGTGLGLILCNEFMEKHSGSIEVESEPGKGSVFSFELISVDI
jgi:signal transduction histidine kinase